MSNISKIFSELAEKKEGALIAYVMGGDPDLHLSQKIITSVIKAGADILEIGVPFSDPVADGKSIQDAGIRSLSAGTRPKDVLELVRTTKEIYDLPIVIMSYYNILYSQTIEAFLDHAKECKVDGIIVPDLPLDEAGNYAKLARRRGIDVILLAAPTTSPKRMKTIVEFTSGFLYLVSLLGVTGAREELRKSTMDLIKRAKDYTKGMVPLGVGFGISKPEHVRSAISAGADGAIVGSGIVNQIADNLSDEDMMLKRIESYVSSLKEATRV